MKKTEYNYSKLRGRIVEKFGTIAVFAEKTSRTRTYVSSVLNHNSELYQSDIDEWANLLDIDDSELGLYFFARWINYA